MCSVRVSFRVSVFKSLVNEPGKRVDCVNERTMIANLLVQASCLVGCKSTVK